VKKDISCDVATNIFIAWCGPDFVYRATEHVGSNWTTTPWSSTRYAYGYSLVLPRQWTLFNLFTSQCLMPRRTPNIRTIILFLVEVVQISC